MAATFCPWAADRPPPWIGVAAMNKRNPIAKSLRSAHLRQRVVRPKKGKGSYSRKGRKA